LLSLKLPLPLSSSRRPCNAYRHPQFGDSTSILTRLMWLFPCSHFTGRLCCAQLLTHIPRWLEAPPHFLRGRPRHFFPLHSPCAHRQGTSRPFSLPPFLGTSSVRSRPALLLQQRGRGPLPMTSNCLSGFAQAACDHECLFFCLTFVLSCSRSILFPSLLRDQFGALTVLSPPPTS
jgi:hypothetical protein